MKTYHLPEWIIVTSVNPSVKICDFDTSPSGEALHRVPFAYTLNSNLQKNPTEGVTLWDFCLVKLFINDGFQVLVMDGTEEDFDDHAVIVQNNGVGIGT